MCLCVVHTCLYALFVFISARRSLRRYAYELLCIHGSISRDVANQDCEPRGVIFAVQTGWTQGFQVQDHKNDGSFGVEEGTFQ